MRAVLVFPVAAATAALTLLAGCAPTPPARAGATDPATRSASPAPRTAAPAAPVAEIVHAGVGDPLAGDVLGQAMTAASMAAGSARFTQTVTPGGGQTGSFRLAGPPASQVVSDVVGHREYIAIGEKGWVKGFPRSEKPWAASDQGPADTRALVQATFGQARIYSPSLWSQMIAGTTGTVVTKEGGTSTVRFSLTVAQYSAPLGPVGALAEGGTITGDVQVDLTVTDAGLPQSVTTADTVLGQRFTKTLTYAGWGEPVDITAPPADQVGPLPTLFEHDSDG